MIVYNTGRVTLLPIIKREVEIEFIIHMNEWRAYGSLSDHGAGLAPASLH